MAYAVINDYLPQSKYKLKSPYEMVPSYITIHNTANDASAVAEIAYMQSNSNQTSYHVAVDDKHVIQAIPFNRNGWHAGDGGGPGNRKSIGIEICYSRSGGEKYKQAEENAIDYTAQLLKKYGWGIDRVKYHREWSGKNCPHRILDESRGASFKNAIAKRLDELTNKEVDGVSQTKGIFRIKTGTFPNAKTFADAVDKIKADFGLLIYEAADTTSFNPNYRIYTGTFTAKEVAQEVETKIKAKYGWTTYLIEETK